MCTLCVFSLHLSIIEYPDPPSEVEVSETDKSLLVSWKHKPSLPESNPVTSFTVHLNGEKCSQLPASASSQCIEIVPKDLKRLDEDITIGSSVQLTVRALAGHHESRDSQPLLLTRKQLSLLLSQHSKMLGSEESSSSEVSVSSSEEEKKTYSPAKIENNQSHVTSGDDRVTSMIDHVTNGVQENNQDNQQGKFVLPLKIITNVWHTRCYLLLIFRWSNSLLPCPVRL